MGLYSAGKEEERFPDEKNFENMNPWRQTGLSCDNKYKQRGIDQSHSPATQLTTFLVTESNSIKNNDEKPGSGSGMADTPDRRVDFSPPLCWLGGDVITI